MFAQPLVTGLMLGDAYALVAIGYTIIFGMPNLFHPAHRDAVRSRPRWGWRST
jgi:branched-subunit amino acid ABC-type transport system permease component